MAVQVKRDDLRYLLDVAWKAVGSERAVMPILASVLLTADDGNLVAMSNDLTRAIIVEVEAESDEWFSIPVPFRPFNELIKLLDDDETIMLTIDDTAQTLIVRGEKSTSEFQCFPTADFPEFPEFDPNQNMTMGAEQFCRAVREVSFSASKDEGRPTLMGVLMRVDESNLEVMSADGFRASYHKAQPQEMEARAANVPSESLDLFASIVDASGDSAPVSMNWAASHAYFEHGGVRMATVLIEGKFPDLSEILNRKTVASFTADRRKFLQACKAVAVVAREVAYNGRFDIDPNNGVNLSATFAEVGSGEAEIDAIIEADEPIQIAFNLKYLQEFLKSVDSDSVRMAVANDAPGFFTPVGRDNLTHVIMPMRLA